LATVGFARFRERVNSNVPPGSALTFDATPTCFGRIDRSDQAKSRSAPRSDIHEEASVKTKEQDEHGTSQTSIRHHPRKRSAMREYAVAPIHTSGVALRHVGPRDATSVPLSILTGPLLNPDLVTS